MPNSNYASGVATLTGGTGDTVTVACDAGYSGAGAYTCGSDGAFTGAACTACAGGTYSSATNSDEASDCTDADPGYYATTGSTEQTCDGRDSSCRFRQTQLSNVPLATLA